MKTREVVEKSMYMSDLFACNLVQSGSNYIKKNYETTNNWVKKLPNNIKYSCLIESGILKA
jgi:hypothetical protein